MPVRDAGGQDSRSARWYNTTVTERRAGLKRWLWTAARPARNVAAPLVGSVVAAVTDEPVVALTFDDGPDPETTPRMLDVLDRHEAVATFFVLVDRAEEAPQVVRATRARGHEVGLHGLVHRRLQTASTAETMAVIRQGRQRLEALIDAPVTLFRPPGGAQTVRSLVIARASGLRTVLWSATARDWVDQPLENIVVRTLDQLDRGGIALLHDGPQGAARRPISFDRAELVDRLLTRIAERGWRTVTVTELLTGRRLRRQVSFKARRRERPAPVDELR